MAEIREFAPAVQQFSNSYGDGLKEMRQHLESSGIGADPTAFLRRMRRAHFAAASSRHDSSVGENVTDDASKST